jgi:hypothetical protein
MIQSLSDLLDTKAAYLTDKVAVVFKDQPSLESIQEVRRLLDRITDEMIREKLNGRSN